ncbi:hypothetical protein [Endozoicomonas sp. ONNA1]|uniref:GTPase activation domain-containing protein n=1 Tax=Endozoicomonas sp. ONNA1 TaxID=2828740 RepID=UPI00214982E9|nr:hypothetical protein [Endozoicomonas sp. ONNA1]
MSNSVLGKIALYGCGGCGINLVSGYNNTMEAVGFATLKTTYVDSSRSNIKPELEEKDCYILKGVDGSGKVRSENYEAIRENVKELLLTHTPEVMNIVVFSASGGTGSVFGPLIMRELLDRGLGAVAIVIGSTECKRSAENSLNLIKSLESISQNITSPLVVSMNINSKERSRSMVDKDVVSNIDRLMALASGQNGEMDSKDILNWLAFHQVTTVDPQLALLEITDNEDDARAVRNPIAVANLLKDTDVPDPELYPEYAFTAYYPATPDGWDQNLNFIISTDGCDELAEKFIQEVNRYEEIAKSRSSKVTNALKGNEKVEDEGMIL